MYETPYDSDSATRKEWTDYTKKLDELLAANQRGDAVALFMKLVGNPADQIAGMRQAPIWPMFEAVAPTLAYDAAAIGGDRSVPTKRASQIGVPVLVMNGTAVPFMLETGNALAKSIPHAKHLTLEGQTHDVKLELLAPILVEFFSEQA